MKRILLTAPAFLGDEIVFTGAVREIKRETGWSIRIATINPDLWAANGSIDGIGATGAEDITISHHHCPPFRGMDNAPLHFLEQYVRNLRGALRLAGDRRISKFGGDVPLTTEELVAEPPFGLKTRYWLVSAGFKTGVPTKGWPSKHYQEVVDALRGRMVFVQIGSRRDWHPPLRGVIDLVGKTSLRDLIRLIHHAEGVLCPITSLMHLAAAVPPAPHIGFKTRPCVVIAGGREAVHFINYPMHRVLNTVGLLPCCELGGCGKSRFGKGQCLYPEVIRGDGAVSRCMALIRPADVVAAIEFFYRGDARLPRYLGRVSALFRHLQRSRPVSRVIRGAEVGVHVGEMSAQLLQGHFGLHLIMVDRWQRRPDDETDPNWYSRPQSFFDGAMTKALEATRFAAERRRVTHKSSVEAAAEVEDGTLDFVFIDADHGYQGCRDDIQAWLLKLKPDGLLCGHDYNRPQWPREGVKRAVDEFAAKHGVVVETDKDNTWFIHLAAASQSEDALAENTLMAV